MQFRLRSLLPLMAAALAGGAVALAGAAALGVGDRTTTTTVRPYAVFGQDNAAQTTATSGRPLSIHEIYSEAAPGVVQISSTTVVHLQPDPFGFGFGGTETQRSLGSGFVMDRAGHIITNYHVIAHAKSIEVSFSDNDSMNAKLVGADPATDVAVLKIDAHARALHPLRLGNSDELQVGDSVVAIGNPLGLDRSITAGIVSALQRQIDTPAGAELGHVIQTDAPINKGNSGGPLLNARGQVIGVNSAIQTADPGSSGNIGIGFAIPINTVKDVAAQLIKTGHVEHAALGVRVEDISPQIAKLFSLPARRGVLVTDVVPGSAAARAGIHGGSTNVVVEGESYRLGGDLIVKFDGAPLLSAQQLRDLVAAKKPGDTVQLELYRGNDKQTIDVKLGRQRTNSPPP